MNQGYEQNQHIFLKSKIIVQLLLCSDQSQISYHSLSLQVNYSSRWKAGFGLTDGEDMERLWSFLRRFSYSTKEMTSAHRIDFLTDGLLHYGRKKNSEIGKRNWHVVILFLALFLFCCCVCC